jgi:uncharacterized protein
MYVRFSFNVPPKNPGSQGKIKAMRLGLSVALLACSLLAWTHRQDVEHWRQQRETSLKADDCWLTVAGLFWLTDGENTVGSDHSSVILLPRGPAHLGVFEFHRGKTNFRPAPGINVPARTALKSDTDGAPDLVQYSDFTMFIIHRGDRYAVRLKDKQSEFRESFTGLRWYPVRDEYLVTAKWVRYPEPKMMAVPKILGETEQQPSPGYAVFQLHGRECQLHPVIEEDKLFFIFRDQTSGKETYPSGRFLYADSPPDGQVVLDFNKAYNPPCAFTPYATCPLPPRENRLAVRIEAGELDYGHHDRP